MSEFKAYDVTTREGYVWPSTDEHGFPCIYGERHFLLDAVSFCPQYRTAIQAGGNAGMYPSLLAELFDKVVTFEPEERNLYCLRKNTMKFDNVEIYEGVIGDSNDPVAISGWEPNCGSYEVCGPGDIKQYRIDDLDVGPVDFIQLDVQGFELRVLKGAIETIRRYSPVIQLEEGYGKDNNCAPFLMALGYEEVARSGKPNRITDAVYAKA